MKSSYHRQRGMTLIGWVMTLFIIGFIALFAIRLTPVYIHYQAVSSIMDNVAHDPEATSSAAIYRTLGRRLSVNELRHIVSERDFKLGRDNGARTLEIQYEERTSFIGNIDLVVSFHKKVELSGG